MTCCAAFGVDTPLSWELGDVGSVFFRVTNDSVFCILLLRLTLDASLRSRADVFGISWLLCELQAREGVFSLSSLPSDDNDNLDVGIESLSLRNGDSRYIFRCWLLSVDVLF